MPIGQRFGDLWGIFSITVRGEKVLESAKT